MSEPEPTDDRQPPDTGRIAEITALIEQASALRPRTAVMIEAPDPQGETGEPD